MASESLREEYIDNYLQRYCEGTDHSNRILFHITRTKNKNVVIYEGKKGNNGELCVDGYWLDIDPEAIRKTRSKGITNDRVELNVLDKKMAYGFSIDRSENDVNSLILSVVSFPQRVIKVERSGEKSFSASCTVAGRNCLLRKVFVKSVERRFMWPKVEYVRFYGEDIETHEIFEEKVNV